MANHLDVMAQMVKHQQGIGEHEHRFRQSLWIGRHRGNPRLKVADAVIGQVTDAAAVKSGKPLDGYQVVPVHFFLNGTQRVDFAQGLFLPCLYNPVGIGADKAVPTQALSARDTFQEEGIGWLSYLQIRGNRSFQVGINRPVDWHQVAVVGSRQRLDVFKGRIVHTASDSKSYICCLVLYK